MNKIVFGVLCSTGGAEQSIVDVLTALNRKHVTWGLHFQEWRPGRSDMY